MAERVSVSVEGGVADVRLTRGDKMNAFDDEMFRAVAAAGEALKDNREVRAVLLSGEGRCFSAGLDMASFAAVASGEGGLNLSGMERTPGGANPLQQAVMVWREVPQPVIAVLHGAVFGAGFQLALGADIRIAAPDAQLCAMEIKWGLVPDMGAFVLLPRLVRDDVARELLFSGRIVEAEEAARLGLITRVAADARAEAARLAAQIAGRSPSAIRAAKRLAGLAATAPVTALLLEESREQDALLGSPNQIEAVMANLAKRDPNFTD